MNADKVYIVLIAITAVAQAQPNSLKAAPAMGLKNQVVYCSGKFLCGVTLGNRRKVTCIDKTLVCNGNIDCINGVDEIGCHIETTPVLTTSATSIVSTTTPALTTSTISVCSPCTQGQYQCTGTEMCLDIALVCDGIEDCPNKDDEVSCPICPEICPNGTYRCNGGTPSCVEANKKCDETEDCENGDDELQCDVCSPCTQGQYQCTDSEMCLDIALICDGNGDCPNKDDEASCPVIPEVCPDGSYRCNGGSPTCVTADELCDGRPDCQNNDDELKICDCLFDVLHEPSACALRSEFDSTSSQDSARRISFVTFQNEKPCGRLCCRNPDCAAYVIIPMTTRSLCVLYNSANFSSDFNVNYQPAPAEGCPSTHVTFYGI